MTHSTGPILLVEDDPDLRAAVELLLLRQGYDVVATGDGVRAVAMAEECEPALALVDLLLPGQSGFQVTLALKARFGDRVRVVVMSGTSADHHQDYATASGADHFLEKPFATSALLAVVAALCPLPTPSARRKVKIGS
ncbi:MAG: response regulator [Gemmataceae bacterium]|nr:response regulator [Gemmataceae bacterium]